MTHDWRYRCLVFVLRFSGAVLMLAWLAMFQPTSWMAANHRLLGLGEFPATPVVDYLARSISGLYGIHGGLYFLALRDLRRYRGLVTYLASMNLLFGAMLVAIDWNAGLPWWWTLGEGPSLIAFAAVTLWLLRAVPRDGEVQAGVASR